MWVGEVGDEYINNFNPYAAASGGPPSDLIYESLLFTNLANGTMNPWLATKYQFSNDNKQLVFTLHDNVKWNDGQPFTPQLVKLTKNTSYWQAGKPAFNEIDYPIYKSNDTLVLQLISNKLDTAQVYVPNLDRNYVQKDTANHHFWLAPNATLMFYPNNAKKPFNQVAVRQAISQALDRSKMSKVAENGYMQVANPTALILPSAKDFLASNYANLSFWSIITVKFRPLGRSADRCIPESICYYQRSCYAKTGDTRN
ncbi:ABC transporter substrate-binding protein [Dictyobacter kobayashii]|uniref:Solute-binding protein family 5 domain-containing protein n=1 Tax=Dictyobacter kobayashii TaxID=2014872 RepID=A0A402AXF8_9CHLR|nr:ABC transporter substrate-binding protein [Dictyobacter kobayashii]GCE23744.1 hypothetical protein KDK_75440 [Dictyobacter kobayashii]